jgi:hypothetical protein
MAHSTDESTQPARERATAIVSKAWQQLPHEHRHLLEEVGAAQWTIVTAPLGQAIHRLLRSAGSRGLGEKAQDQLAVAVAAWVPSLRVVVLNASHRALTGLSDNAQERFLTETAWHEWGHALSIARCTAEDVASGARLLDRAPTAVSKHVRRAGYRPRDYTHELIAETYAMLVGQRQQGKRGRPPWLDQEIYELVRRVTAWPD